MKDIHFPRFLVMPQHRGMSNTNQRTSQCDRLLALLNSRANEWVSLPDILVLGIAQYNARIFELRSLGHRIENKQEGDHSWFRLVLALAPISEQTSPEPSAAPLVESLFPEPAPERHRDDG